MIYILSAVALFVLMMVQKNKSRVDREVQGMAYDPALAEALDDLLHIYCTENEGNLETFKLYFLDDLSVWSTKSFRLDLMLDDIPLKVVGASFAKASNFMEGRKPKAWRHRKQRPDTSTIDIFRDWPRLLGRQRFWGSLNFGVWMAALSVWTSLVFVIISK